MKLLLLRQWTGTREHGCTFDEQASVATNLSLGEALVELGKYEEAYKRRYRGVSICFTLLSVSEIDDLEEHHRYSISNGIPLVEEMVEGLSDATGR